MGALDRHGQGHEKGDGLGHEPGRPAHAHPDHDHRVHEHDPAHEHDPVHGHGHDHGHVHGAHAAHPHVHDHAHGAGGHVHAPATFGAAFAIGIALNGGFVVAEVVFGLRSDSLALVADAGHNLSDVLALLLAWGASVLVQRAPFGRYTYGLRGTSILAALINACLLLLVTGAITWEALVRLQAPPPVAGLTVVVVAAVGVAVNLATALLFLRGGHDLNLRAAFIHMAGDAAISGGVVASGLVMMRTGWRWLDPAASLAISLAVIAATWALLRDSVRLALQGVPPAVDLAAVRSYLGSVDGVARVHDLHIWGMSTTENALTVRLVFPHGFPGDARLREICVALRERHGIAHATLQVETSDSGETACAIGAR